MVTNHFNGGLKGASSGEWLCNHSVAGCDFFSRPEETLLHKLCRRCSRCNVRGHKLLTWRVLKSFSSFFFQKMQRWMGAAILTLLDLWFGQGTLATQRLSRHTSSKREAECKLCQISRRCAHYTINRTAHFFKVDPCFQTGMANTDSKY